MEGQHGLHVTKMFPADHLSALAPHLAVALPFDSLCSQVFKAVAEEVFKGLEGRGGAKVDLTKPKVRTTRGVQSGPGTAYVLAKRCESSEHDVGRCGLGLTSMEEPR